jgi:DNA helicase-2/ATP-dependent DNA helicase PcrA
MLFGNRAYNLPSRFLDELPEHGVVRERLSPARWDYGRKTPVEVAPRDHPALSTGDSVRHQSFGEGVVTGIDAGGVVTIRFEDGNERRLMLDYAPLEKVV